MYQPDPDLDATLQDLETVYVELLDKTTSADKEAIGEFWQEALEVFGTPEDIFNAYPDAAWLLLGLQADPVRSQMLELLRYFRKGGEQGA